MHNEMLKADVATTELDTVLEGICNLLLNFGLVLPRHGTIGIGSSN